MERTTMVFLALLVILVVGYFFTKEDFTDSSGSSVTLSVADLMKVLGQAKQSQPSGQTQAQQPIVIMNPPVGRGVSNQYSADPTSAYLNMKDEILTDVKDSIGNQFAGSPLSSAYSGGIGSSCQQGNSFVESIPGKSPADDYIRKDSIPCYACSLP